MEKKLLAEVDGRYVRQTGLGHYGVVGLQIYTIDVNEVLFQNCCPPEQIPERFAAAVERRVYDFAEESGITNLLVCLVSGWWHEYDSHEKDFDIATLLALWKVFPKK